jgi:tRNA (cytidine/uridine-2'-O-)-methyltransferase
MTLAVVLVAPEIAGNTGNVIRLCANVGAELHLVEPLGFSMDEARLRRAGLDYHDLTALRVHMDMDAARAVLVDRRWLALTSRGVVRYDEVSYRDDDVLVFGSEGAGLAVDVLAGFPTDTKIRLPMRPNNRSLNLANAVAVVAYEAWRQIAFAGSVPHIGATAAEQPAL